MADFSALHTATLALRDILRTAITESTDPALKDVPIELRSPRDMKDATVKTGISLWLYRVARFAELTNDMPVATAPDLQPRRALPLELSYLVTPVHADAERRQLLAGRVLETLNDHATVAAGSMELRVNLDTLTLDAHLNVVQSLGVPMPLTLPYAVQVVTIESALPPRQVPRVVRRDAAYAQVVGMGAP